MTDSITIKELVTPTYGDKIDRVITKPFEPDPKPERRGQWLWWVLAMTVSVEAFLILAGWSF